MSFFYDRDQNVTGTIPASFTFTPSYGMQVSFSSELAEYGTVDNYIYNMPKGLNHLQMQISMPFENRKEEQARQIVGFFESLQGTGYFAYTDAAQIYKPLNLFVNNIDNTYNENDLYNINVSASTDQSSTLLNWNNLFVTGSNYHIGFVSDFAANSLKLYVNGVRIKTATFTAAGVPVTGFIAAPDLTLRVFRENTNQTILSEFRIYTGSLTDAEIESKVEHEKAKLAQSK